MTFNKVAVDFGDAEGFAFYPLDTKTNYRRIILLTPKKPEKEGEDPKPFYFFEYFEGHKVVSAVPLKYSRKKRIDSKTEIYVLEEPFEETVYNSPPIADQGTVGEMTAWLEANTLNAGTLKV